ncbi:MAG: hypothetical protein ACFFE2_00950 [Candidatus Thorarchaeota archaeon]
MSTPGTPTIPQDSLNISLSDLLLIGIVVELAIIYRLLMTSYISG